MNVRIIVLVSVLAVSGVALLRRSQAPGPAPIPGPAATFQAMEVSAPEQKVIASAIPVVEKAEEELVVKPVAPVAEVFQEAPAPEENTASYVEPVQTLEERGDAMLFESQALMDTPFDQAVTMPFGGL